MKKNNSVPIETNVAVGNYQKKWYNNENFPIKPDFWFKKADYHNVSKYGFSWLILKVWTLSSFEFDISFTMSTHWGIGITAILPYLRIILCIPCPHKLDVWIFRNLHRKSKSEQKNLKHYNGE